jgi:hypothetical protein
MSSHFHPADRLLAMWHQALTPAPATPDDATAASAERHLCPPAPNAHLASRGFAIRTRKKPTFQRRSRPLADLIVLVLTLATPSVLVLVGQVGVAALLAVAEFGAIIMRAW